MRGLAAFVFAVVLQTSASLAVGQAASVSSLGRIEPAGGVVRLAGPSGLGSVIMELNVEEGQQVTAGDVIATLDSYPVRRAELDRYEAELKNAT